MLLAWAALYQFPEIRIYNFAAFQAVGHTLKRIIKDPSLYVSCIKPNKTQHWSREKGPRTVDGRISNMMSLAISELDTQQILKT